MGFTVESSGKTDVGLVREKNEDALLIDPTMGLYVVCDGMGGHVGGQVASQLAALTVSEVISTRDAARLPEEADWLVTAIRAANSAVFRKAKADPALHNMGTTVVAMREDDTNLHLAHVGDSRIYRLREGNLEQVTEDHSLINLYKKNPKVASQYGPPSSNVIVRAVGLGPDVQIDHRLEPMRKGDLYLLCCDGLTDIVEDWMILEMLTDAQTGSLEEGCDALLRAALVSGGVDNVTALLVRIS